MSKKTKTVLIVVGVLLLIALIIGGIVWYKKSQQKNDPDYQKKKEIVDQIYAKFPNVHVDRDYLMKKSIQDLLSILGGAKP